MDAAFIWNLSKLGRIGSRRLQFDDDFADRLNYQYTGVLLFLFIGLIGVRQYVGKPIQCWIPQEFTRGWEEYAENYCWVANTYFAPVQDRLPPVPDRRELLLVYYQWAPIVMAAQALLFYLPCLTWRLGMAHSGFNLHRILQMAAEANEMVPETAAKTVAILSHYIKCCIQRQKVCVQQNSTCCRVGTYSRLVSDAHLSHWGSGRTGNLVDKSRSFLVQKSSLTAVEEVARANPFQPSEEDLRDSSLSVSGDEVIFGQFCATTTARMRDSSSLGSTENGTDQHGQHPVKTKSGGTDQTGSNASSGRARKPAPPPPSTLPVNQNTTVPLPSPETSTKKGGLSGQKHGSNTSSTPLKAETEEKNIKEKGKKSGESRQTDDKTNATKTLTHASSGWRCGRKHGNFLISLYLTVKCCYLLNVIGQIYLMQSFIGSQYSSYGARVLIDLIKGREWHHSGHFPRVTFCDLEAKKLGKNHVYTLQCVLPLNMFLEKIYIFLWFWHVAIATITFLSLLVWLHRVFPTRSRTDFILRYLRPLDPNLTKFRVDWEANDREFVDSYLGYDGLFIIRLISANCGGMLAGELVYSLWYDFSNPQSNGTEKLMTTVSRLHPLGGYGFPGQNTTHDWPATRDSQYAYGSHPQPYWRTLDSAPNYRNHSSRTHLSSSFSRQNHLMGNRNTNPPIHMDFSPGERKHLPTDDRTHSTHPSKASFQNGQIHDDIV